MSIQEFTPFIWPFIALVSIILFRKPIAGLIERFSHLRLVRNNEGTTLELVTELDRKLREAGIDSHKLADKHQSLADLPEQTKNDIQALLSELRQQGRDVESPEALLALANGFMAEGSWLEAAQHFRRYAALRPEDWSASYARGVAYANSRMGEATEIEALRAYNDALVYAPSVTSTGIVARLYGYRGAILKRLGRIPDAEADLVRALDLASESYEHIDVRYNLACVYALSSRRSEMIQILKEGFQSTTPCLKERYISAIRGHLEDYFRAYASDPELLSLINAA